jgi:hypothetical protein
LWLSALAVTVTLILAGTWVWAYDAPNQTSRPEYWVAHPTTSLPPTIEPDDARWDEATPLYLPLHAGSHGPRTDEGVELRALYDSTSVAFRARWREVTPAQVADRFALIWHKDDLPDQRGQDCGTACHIAQRNRHSDTPGLTVVPTFVPAGREEPLPTRATWRDGVWTLTWSRPLRSLEVRDIQFVDLSQRYRVRAKVFLDLNHKPDWLTEDTYLVFARSDQ